MGDATDTWRGRAFRSRARRALRTASSARPSARLRRLRRLGARRSLSGVTFHGLRHSFVAILVAAGCDVREVSEWAGHNNVAFTLTRYGGLFEDGSDEAGDPPGGPPRGGVSAAPDGGELPREGPAG